MLWVLVKKQLAEVFKGYFYDAKKNRMRPRWAVIAWFAFFAVVMIGVLGGMFTFLSLSVCGPLVHAGMGWLFFLLLGLLALLLGAAGSVFNTYAGLYLSRDNDLLLSMPIPVSRIVAARLVNVYLMGALYSATVLLPALVVYWRVAGATAARVACGVALYMIVSMLVLLVSCLLGWVVAKISLRLKNRSYVAVLAALLLIGGYYAVAFRAKDIARNLLLNATVYGDRIRGMAGGLYLFGRIGEGDLGAAALFLAATAALSALVWVLLTRSFLSVAADGGRPERVHYAEKPLRERSPFGALLAKEFGRFTASANYMMNCGMGVVFMLAGGVLLLVKGPAFCAAIEAALAGKPDAPALIFCAALCAMASINDMAAPSVSLEGKSLWIPRSLPVEPKTVLRAKACMQLILTGLPMLFASACAAAVVRASAPVRLLLCALPLAWTAFSAVFATAVGVRLPLLNWTSELAPIKQSASVLVSMLGGWIVSAAVCASYLLIGYRLGAAPFMAAWTALLAVAAWLLLRWLDTRGAEIFAAL